MDTCKLCDLPSTLQNSHVIPSFVGEWLKETSITGYLRQASSPNLRRQAITKLKLLCKSCETLLSVNENLFKKLLFEPYVTKELDEWGIANGVINEIKYGSWLLDFTIGLQWRSLITHEEIVPVGNESPDVIDGYKNLINSELCNWKNYLIKKQSDSGKSRHYLIFLQNLVGVNGYVPSRVNKKVNTYLIRSVDATLAISNSHLFLFTKMGPLVILSAINPIEFDHMNDAKIKRKGSMPTAQHLKNKYVNEFIFIVRPNEAFSLPKVSETQMSKIATSVKSKLKSDDVNLQEAYLAKSNEILQERIRKQNE